MEKISSDIKLIIDSREKWTQSESGRAGRMAAYFSAHCIWEVRKLDVGDYMFEGGTITIDRKQNLDELAKNLTNPKDHARFMKEVRRAKAQGLRLVVLCECGGTVKGIPDVATWQSKHSPVSGRYLMERIYQVHISYGVEFLFCDKRSTPRRIVEILSGEE